MILAFVSAGSLIRLRPQRFPRIDEEQLLTDANIEDDTQPRLNFSLGKVRVPLRYGIYMHITVNGIKETRSNILHFSTDGEDYATAGSRMPALYLAANSTTLVFAVAQEVYNLTALPIGKETFLAIKCYDENRVRVSYDQKEVSVFEPKTNRSTGYAQFYLGNPWEEPANVTINNLRMFDRQEIRWKGRNKSNDTYGAVMTEEPIPSWAFQETAILSEILLANGYKLTNLKNRVVCPNRTDYSVFSIVTVPVSNFQARCSDGYLDYLHLWNLKTLPQSVGKLRKLQTLWIYYGQVKELPSTIGNLTNLQGLYVYNNQLSSLPQELCKLTKLNYLYQNLTQGRTIQQTSSPSPD